MAPGSLPVVDGSQRRGSERRRRNNMHYMGASAMTDADRAALKAAAAKEKGEYLNYS